MLDSIILQSTNVSASFHLAEILFCCITSLVLGGIISFSYILSSKYYTKNFVISLVILPILVQMVIMLVNGNLGTGVAIVGAFSLVRFRSVPGSSKEICAVFFAMAIGLATGMGYIGYAIISTFIIAIPFVLLHKFDFGTSKVMDKSLKVLIPEDLNYENIFDDIFETYCVSYEIDKVKTTNLGSMFELSYKIEFKKNKSEKQFLDQIRCRNGNLTISISKYQPLIEEL
ncbi:MAG: DUF4956 domain-containing protein [Lachnospiraceae bacterium]